MGQNFSTVKSITDNIQNVFQKEGIKFTRATYENKKNIPISLIPHGEIFYKGESFEYTHGQRQGYNEINYLVRVILRDTDPASLIMETQKWIHNIRNVFTVNALNIGDLSASKLVSLAIIKNIEIENKIDIAILILDVIVRYRET